MEKYIELAYKEAQKAFKSNEIPVGAVIVKNNKIISKAFNKKEKKRNPIFHAEILAIIKACKKLKTWHLDDCEIYVTMEPCLMCYSAIEQARIKKITYISNNLNFGFNSKYNILTKIKIEKISCICDYDKLLKKFFKNKR